MREAARRTGRDAAETAMPRSGTRPGSGSTAMVTPGPCGGAPSAALVPFTSMSRRMSDSREIMTE